MKMIHCIGDSHASLFSGEDGVQPEWPDKSSNKVPGYCAYRLGGALAYNLCKPGSTSGGRERLFQVLKTLDPGSLVLLMFGEIDCRIQMTRRWLAVGGSPKDVVEPCVDRYCSVVREVEASGFRVLVWNAVASSPTAPASRVVGTCQDRNTVTVAFNKSLEDRLGKSFVSIFEHLVDGMTTKRDCYFDENHVAQKMLPVAMSAVEKAL